MIDDETSEVSTIDCSQPTLIDATLIDQPPHRLRDILATARDRHGWAPAAILTLLLGINLLILGRMSTTETGESIETGSFTGFDRAPVATTVSEVATRAPSGSEPDPPVPPETRETALRKAWGPELPPAAIDWEYRSRLHSGQTLRIEAAIDSKIGSILPAVHPAGPPPSVEEAKAIEVGATPRESSSSPAAASNPRGEKDPQRSSESTGGQGWIIER
jgi:hypothetical protein